MSNNENEVRIAAAAAMNRAAETVPGHEDHASAIIKLSDIAAVHGADVLENIQSKPEPKTSTEAELKEHDNSIIRIADLLARDKGLLESVIGKKPQSQNKANNH